MKRLSAIGMATAVVVSFALPLLFTDTATAATARVKCRVASGRLRIQVDGEDLNPGKYLAILKNLKTGASARTTPGKEKTATTLSPDVDLDFDSTAQANDLDSYISPTFATVGQGVSARVGHFEKNAQNVNVFVTDASASTTCTQ